MEKQLEKYLIEIIYEHAVFFAQEIYGDVLDNRISERLDKEFNSFKESGHLEQIFNAAQFIDKKKGDGELLVSHLSINNSFLFYLFGLSVVNPLPRHYYCPKCHSFHWGNKSDDVCENCGEKLIEDGYNLPFEPLLDDIKRIGLIFNYAATKDYLNSELSIKFFKTETLCIAKKLGITQLHIETNDFDKEEIIKQPCN